MNLADLPWPAITTGVFAVTGAIGGVLVTQRYASAIARTQLGEARRNELRSNLTMLLSHGSLWAGEAGRFHARLLHGGGLLVTELADDPEYMKHLEASEELSRALVDASLRVADADLAESIGVAKYQFDTSFAFVGLEGWFLRMGSSEAKRQEFYQQGREHLGAFVRSLSEVEQRAAELLRVTHMDGSASNEPRRPRHR